MDNLVVKTKTFIKDHKTEIVVGGLVVGTIAYKMHIYKIRKMAFEKGVMCGFQAGIDWFDKNFDNLNLRQLWEKWAIANPDKVIYR